ncbi:MAG: hypothetical protein JW937_07450 [Candidatus Omnitrophica bacterium]|nr:hypothetical protein [Candidatus Omnitrophota bacterium]
MPVIILAIVVLGICARAGLTQNSTGWPPEDYESKTTVKETKGLRFDVPEDWPIVERGGIIAPVSVAEYMDQRMKAVEKRMSLIETKFNDLESRLLTLEEVQSGSGSLRSSQ